MHKILNATYMSFFRTTQLKFTEVFVFTISINVVRIQKTNFKNFQDNFQTCYSNEYLSFFKTAEYLIAVKELSIIFFFIYKLSTKNKTW